MKHKPHYKEKKSISMRGLLEDARNSFNSILSQRKVRNITQTDCLMSALAMFSLKSPSLLAFDQQKMEEAVEHNLQTLYKTQNPPCDTYMREVLDEIDPQNLRKSFLSIFHKIQREKLLERYTFLGKYLCLVDGSEIFNSEKVHCKHCCQKNHKDGRKTYHHQILGVAIAHPNMRQVIPLCPESITKKDGESKNDCEQNAFKRVLQSLKKEHPRLKLILVSDALSANASHIKRLNSLGYSFIISVKAKGNRSLFEWVHKVTREKKVTVGKNKYIFRYVNKVPLNNTKKAPLVNFLECEAQELKGKKIINKYFSWITDHEIQDNNVYELMLGGRARWKIENETFNTLKNQGYQFEHNFGHGKKHLHTVFAFLMMLAFLIDQIQEATCGMFQAALISRKSRRAFWERMRSFFYTYLIKSWKDLFEAMKPGFKGAVLNFDTS